MLVVIPESMVLAGHDNGTVGNIDGPAKAADELADCL